MGRPRQHDLEDLLDQARSLWIEDGVAGVTIRALSTASGASNGAIYHAFGSRDCLLASVWTREADKFLSFQRDLVERAMGEGGPVDGLVAAALAPAAYAARDDQGARLLLTASLSDLLTPELDGDRRADLLRLQRELGGLIGELAEALWSRRDGAAITTVRYCVVDLPGALLLKASAVTDPVARHALERAVRGISSMPPPTASPRRTRSSASTVRE
jgi:AcrR family transcriptional regulator